MFYRQFMAISLFLALSTSVWCLLPTFAPMQQKPVQTIHNDQRADTIKDSTSASKTEESALEEGNLLVEKMKNNYLEKKEYAAKLYMNLLNTYLNKNEKSSRAHQRAAALSDKKMVKALADRDSLYINWRIMQYDYYLNYSFLDMMAFFPSHSSYQTQLFFEGKYDELRKVMLRSSSISLDSRGKQVSLTNEIASGYFGPMRLGVFCQIESGNDGADSVAADSTAVSQKSGVDQALQRFQSGGGNIIVDVGIPVMYFHLMQFPLTGSIVATPRFAYDVPKLNEQVEIGALNSDFGMEANLLASDLVRKFSITGYVRYSLILGNRAFRANLGNSPHKLWLLQYAFGMRIAGNYQVMFTLYDGGHFVRDNFKPMIQFGYSK